mgnify:CR=1 FL=1
MRSLRSININLLKAIPTIAILLLPILPFSWGTASAQTSGSAPVAVAADVTVRAPSGGQASVTLDGSGSFDSDGDPILRYEWILEGEVVSTEAVFTTQRGVGEYLYTLRVVDATESIGSRDVVVRVNSELTGLPGLNTDDPDDPSIADAITNVCEDLESSREPLRPDQLDLLSLCQDILDSTSPPEQLSAINAIAGETITAQQTTALELGAIQSRNISTRMSNLRQGTSGLSVTGLNVSVDGEYIPSDAIEALFAGIIGGSAGEAGGLLEDSRLGLFLQGNISLEDKDQTIRETGFDRDTYGITAGVDYRFSNALFAGLALGYGSSELEFLNDNGALETNGITATLYGSYSTNQFYLDAVAEGSRNNNEMRRRIAYELLDNDRVALGENDSVRWSFGVESGLRFESNGFFGTPNISIFSTQVDTDNFSETNAGGLNLTYSDQSIKSVTASAGFQVGYTYSTDWGVLVPQLRVDYVREFEDDEAIVNVNFVNDPSPLNSQSVWTQTSDRPDRDYLLLGLGVSAQFIRGFSGFIDWQSLQAYDNLTMDSINFGLRWEASF